MLKPNLMHRMNGIFSSKRRPEAGNEALVSVIITVGISWYVTVFYQEILTCFHDLSQASSQAFAKLRKRKQIREGAGIQSRLPMVDRPSPQARSRAKRSLWTAA